MSEESPKKPKRANGGRAVAAKMTKEQLSDRAKKGALGRWGPKTPVTLRKGNFKDEFGINAECYVLDDSKKTAVITQSGMGEILGLGTGGSRLPRFVFNKTMSEYIGPDLREKIEKPVVFQIVSVGQSGSQKANGYDAAVLIDICRAILKAQSDGKAINPKVAAQAGIIVGASAKAGITGLVYALTGYDATREEVIEAFKVFVREEAREYEKEFPDQLYAEWYRIYELPKPERNKPWKFMHLTRKQVYYPLARSRGEILEMTKASKAANTDAKHKKLHQFLSEVGVKALRTHLGQLLGIARISKTQAEYERHVNALFGDQGDLFEDSDL